MTVNIYHRIRLEIGDKFICVCVGKVRGLANTPTWHVAVAVCIGGGSGTTRPRWQRGRRGGVVVELCGWRGRNGDGAVHRSGGGAA